MRRMTLVEEATDWSDLPNDILDLIKAPLLGRDLCCFHGVCRTWRSVPSRVSSSIRLTQQLFSITLSSTVNNIQFPILMSSGREASLCNFYHPIHNTTYVIDVPELATAKIRFSKHGWLLLSQGEFTMFFFNPFTKERIDLPELNHSYCFAGIAFSSSPTSSDCVVFGIHDRFFSSELNQFSFIRRGQNTWTRFIDRNKILDFIPSHNTPVFYDGVFYCLGLKGNLATFEVNKLENYEEEIRGNWTVLDMPKQPCISIRRNYLVEHNGELVSVFEGHIGKWVRVFKLDRSTMAWKKLERIGDDGIFFMSLTSSFSATSTCAAMEVLGMGNKIFFPRFSISNNNGVFYSLVTAKFHSFGIGHTREDCYNTEEKMHCTWIQPSDGVHTDEDLRWYKCRILDSELQE